MPVMAKKKKTTDRHKGEALTLRLDPALKEVLRLHAIADRRSMTQAAIILLEEALEARGLWPPGESEEEGEGEEA